MALHSVSHAAEFLQYLFSFSLHRRTNTWRQWILWKDGVHTTAFQSRRTRGCPPPFKIWPGFARASRAAGTAADESRSPRLERYIKGAPSQTGGTRTRPPRHDSRPRIRGCALTPQAGPPPSETRYHHVKDSSWLSGPEGPEKPPAGTRFPRWKNLWSRRCRSYPEALLATTITPPHFTQQRTHMVMMRCSGVVWDRVPVAPQQTYGSRVTVTPMICTARPSTDAKCQRDLRRSPTT